MKRREQEILNKLGDVIAEVRDIREEMIREAHDIHLDIHRDTRPEKRKKWIQIEPQIVTARYELDDALDFLLSTRDHTEEYFK